jgi:formamidopyrimidine-DNA glycosylase
MPELPDISVYIERLQGKLLGRRLEAVRVLHPFVLRTAVPPIGAAEGRKVQGVERLGKRVVLALEGELFLVLHLMIAGRLRWLEPGAAPPAKIALAALVFDNGTLALTEAGSKRRAAMHLVAGREALAAMDPGGIDVMGCDVGAFAERLRAENHTLKRSLTNPRLFSGIGNAYSDEILFRARLSPVMLTRSMDETAFHPAMAVHGRYGQPCPVCGSPVQRIVFADNETNYCARCQTGGRLLADRALSRLLKASWPRHIDDIEP